MVVLFNQLFVDFEGKTVKNEVEKELTLRIITMNSLVAAYEDERNISGEDKLKRWDLAMKIKNSPDPVEVTAEEVSLIKKLIAKAYGVIIVGQAWKMLEGNKE